VLLHRLLSRWPSLPTQCALCRAWSADRVCGDCRARFAPPVARCARCALRVPERVAVCGACLASPPAFDLALAALDYGHPWDRLIGQLKFHAALDLATPLAQSLVQAWRAGGRPRPDRLVPMPLAPARLAQRDRKSTRLNSSH